MAPINQGFKTFMYEIGMFLRVLLSLCFALLRMLFDYDYSLFDACSHLIATTPGTTVSLTVASSYVIYKAVKWYVSHRCHGFFNYLFSVFPFFIVVFGPVVVANLQTCNSDL